MEDMKKAETGVLETLMRKIPGFSGYLDRERRRDADKLHREFLAKGTTALKAKIQDVQEELMNKGDMKTMARLDDLNNRLDKVTGRLRHANYGYTGFFVQNEVNEQELNRIYEFDLSLVNNLQYAEEALTAVAGNVAGGQEGLADRIRDLENTVKELDAKLDEREKLLKGVA